MLPGNVSCPFRSIRHTMNNKIEIEFIDHDKHRYDTVGDYFYDAEGVLKIKISKMGDQRYERLVLIHELIEIFLIEHAGITIDDIDEFDIQFEKDRKEGDVSEPGFADLAPYRLQHTFATGVELQLAALLDVNWNDYDKTVNEL